MTDEKYFAHLRYEYGRSTLDIADVAPDPIVQFEVWFTQAQEAGLKEPHAMNLATATAQGRPSNRIILLKEFDHRGFTFATNYESRKGHHIDANPHASLCFYWAELERQVRIEGLVERMSTHESDQYFNSRPEGSRIGAWASPQSQLISSRAALEQRVHDYSERFASGQALERPAYWGGYRLRPVLLEFWQGRASRLHDRILYELADDGTWTIGRLAP